MTGFGKAIVEMPNKKIIVEVKSLNSKQLDLSVRVPAQLRETEMEMRNLVAARLIRGKVEVNCYIESIQGEATMQFNLPVIEAYKAQIEDMSARLNIPLPSDWYTLLLRFPETMKSDSASTADDATAAAAIEALTRALDALTDHRAAEGRKLEEFFALRLQRISQLLSEVPQYETERVEHIRARIVDNLQSLPKVEYDRSRLEQEMIFYIEKLDINEEKQR